MVTIVSTIPIVTKLSWMFTAILDTPLPSKIGPAITTLGILPFRIPKKVSLALFKSQLISSIRQKQMSKDFLFYLTMRYILTLS